jgi:hypothetical protein
MNNQPDETVGQESSHEKIHFPWFIRGRGRAGANPNYEFSVCTLRRRTKPSFHYFLAQGCTGHQAQNILEEEPTVGGSMAPRKSISRQPSAVVDLRES